MGVTLQPSYVVYDATLFNQVKEFFTIQEKSKYQFITTNMGQRFQQVVNKRLEELRVATKAEFSHVVGSLTKGYAQVNRVGGSP